jgi:hypothetical protein
MVELEFNGGLYGLTEDEAVLLAQNLRNYAKGTFPADVARAAELSQNPDWAEGALAVADCIEDALVANLTIPVPLEGKAAEATFWTLRLMEGLLGSTDPTSMAALRDDLGAANAAWQARVKALEGRTPAGSSPHATHVTEEERGVTIDP